MATSKYEEYLAKLNAKYSDSKEEDNSKKTSSSTTSSSSGTTISNKSTGRSSTQSTSSTKKTSNYESYLSKMRAKYDEAAPVDDTYINTFFENAQGFLNRASSVVNGLDWKSATSGDRYKSWNEEYTSLREKEDKIRSYLEENKDSMPSSSYKEIVSLLDKFHWSSVDAKVAFSKTKQYYSQWETEEEYNKWKKDTEEYEALLNHDTEKGEAEIQDLEKVLKEYKALSRTMITDRMQERLDYITANYGDEKDIKNLISQKEAYNTQAKRLQEGVRLGSVGDKDSEYYDPEYDYWAKTRSKLPSRDDLVAYDSMMDQSKWYTDANGKLFDAYGNEIDPYKTDSKGNIKHPSNGSVDSSDKLGIFLSASEEDVEEAAGTYLSTGGTWETIVVEGSQRHWDRMKENEINTYYYYLNKEGSEAAEKYLDSIQETLNRREGTEKFKSMEDKTALELLFKVAVGLDQWNSGVQGLKNAITGNDEYIPVSATQVAGSLVQEDLGDVGFKLPEWLSATTDEYGNKVQTSIAQAAGDFITTGANMLPSILTGMAANVIAPGAGAVVGTGLMSASAGGNAYTEMVNYGYDKDQARTYAAMVGASEAVLQSLLGGVSQLGGGLIGKGLSKALGKADHVFAKLAIQFGNSTLGKVIINSIEEGSEEYLQAILEPWFKNIVFGEENEIDLLSEEALYSALLGALTGGVFESSGMALGKANTNAMLRDTGKAIIGADGGVDALKALAMDVSGAKLTNQANKVSSEPATGKGLVGKAVAAVKNSINQKQVGKLYQAVEAEVNTQNQADIAKALNESGFSKSSAKNIAEAVVAKANGAELNKFQEAVLESVKDNKKVDEIVTKVINDPESGVSKRTGNMDAYSMGIMLGKGISPEATREAQKTSLKVSEEGKTIANGKEIQVEFADNGLIATEDGTVDASEVEYATATEAYVVETIANLGLKADAANSLLRTANAKGMNEVQAQAFALGLKNAYNMGRIGNLAELNKNYFTSKLTAEQRETAYAAGLRERNAEVAAKQAAINEAKQKAEEILATKSEPIDKSGSVIFENGVTKKDLSKKQRAAYLVAKKVSSTMGNDIHMYSGKAEYGFHDAETGDVWLNINASASGKDLTLFTLSHEMVHHAKLWSAEEFTAFADMLLEAYGEKGVSVEQMIKNQIRKAKAHGITLTREAAYEEVIADACGRMLIDSNALEKLSLMEETNPGIIEKIKAFLQEFLNKIREMFKDVEPHTAEAIYLAEMEESVKTLLYEKFENLMVSTGKTYSTIKAAYGKDVKAVPNNEIITEGAVTIENDGKKYSIKSMNHDIAEGKMFEDLQTVCGWTEAETKALKEQLEEIVSYMTPFRDIVDMNETSGRDDRRFSPYKPNSDPLYTISMDFSTLCSKRLLTQYVIENLQLRENRPMSAEEQIAIRDMLIEYRQQEKALQVACAMCYVEAARLKSPKQMNRWMNDPSAFMRDYFADHNAEFAQKIKDAQEDFKESRGYDRKAPKKDMKQKDITELNKIRPNLRKGYTPSAEEQAIIDRAVSLPNSVYLTAGNLADLSESDPIIYKAYTSFVRTATRSKGLEQDIAYYYGDSNRDNGNGIIVSDSFIESVNQENGMRFSSWSDWRIEHLLDYITAVIDNSVRGAAMHGYTKFPDEVRVLGNTGMMFNMSGVAGTQTGLNEDGSLSFSESESINFDEAKALREEFPETAGLQCIGVGDEHIRQLLRSDIIDYVIPYHTSGLNAVLRRMVNIHGWKDYTGTQHATPDKSISKDKAKDPENWHKEPVFSEFFVGYKTGMTGVEAMKKTAENYIRMCQERGLTPKFADFMNEDGYWKLLIDRKMVNNETGELIQQKPVKPVFKTDTIKGIVDKYVDNYDSGLQSKALNHIVENWDSLPARIKDLKKAKKSKTKKALDTLANETVAAQPGRKFALPNGAYDHSKSFAEQIEDYKLGLFPRNDTLTVGATPEVFLNIGLNRLPMTYGIGHLKEVLKGNVRNHDFGEAILKQLPKSLKKPVAVIASKTQTSTSLVAIVEMSHGGKQIIAAVYIDGSGTQNGVRIDSNAVTTMHKRDNAVNLLVDAINAETSGSIGVYYLDENKTTRILQYQGLQLPSTLKRPGGYIHSITDPASPVKPQLTSQLETKQFKLWFKGSKAVNSDGTPKVLYHNTDADFDAFDVSLSGSNQGQTHGDGIYLSESKDAFAYAGKKQLALYAVIKKPFEMKLSKKQATYVLEKYAATKHDLDKYNGLYRNHAMEKLRSPVRVFDYLSEYANDNGIKVSDILKDLGFDGVHSWGEWVAFDPTQVKSANQNIGSFDRNNPKFRFSLPEADSNGDPAPTFYSYMAEVVDGVKQEKLGASSVVSMLRGKGVKAEEIKWSGIEDFLEGKKSVTKAELQEFIAGSMLQIEEETLDYKERPYTEDQQKRLDEYEAKRNEIARRVADEWKRITGEEFPVQNPGYDLESTVSRKIIDTNLEHKKNSFEGRLLEKLRKDLQKVIENNDDFGFDSWRDALRSVYRHRKDFIKYYELSANEKAVIVKFCNALEAQNALPPKISEEDSDRLRAIARETVPWDRKIMEVKHEYNEEAAKHMPKWGGSRYNLKGGENYREILFRIPESDYTNEAMFTHWDDRSGILAHARIQDFNTFIGKMLFVEELQSDWHNDGRKDGYASEEQTVRERIADLSRQLDSLVDELMNADASRVYSINKKMDKIEAERERLEKKVESGQLAPDAPFSDTYHEYVLKRLIRMAAEEGYDSIGWTPAQIQVERWSKKFAEGYRIEYDQDMPKFLNKYGKKWGTRVGKTTLDNGTEVWSMAITDSMKDSVLKKGQVMYSLPESGDISTRTLLANAFESVAQDEKEREKLAEYKAKIAFVNTNEQRLREINAKLFQSTTPLAKGERIKLQDEAVKLRNQITIYDSQLLRLEASKPLQNVLNREKAKVRKQMKEQAKKDIRQAKLEEQQRYQNRVASHDKVEMRKKIRKTIRDLDKILNHGDKKKNVKDDMKGLVSSAIQSAEVLFTENYSNEDIIQNGFGVQLGIEEQKHFAEAQNILQQIFNLGTGYEAMADREKLKNKLAYRMSNLREAFFRERNRLNETKVSEVLGNLADAYSSLQTSEYLYIKDAYHASVHEYLKYLQNEVGGTTVRNMSMSQLENLHKAYTMVLETVRNANKMFNENLKESREQLANAIMREVRKAGGEHGDWSKLGIKRNKFSWNNLKPIYAAERIGSETFSRVVSGLFEGQYKWATNMEKARAFQMETAQKYGVNNWDVKKSFEFTSSNDLDFTLNLEQILALYAYSKREAAHDHITNGGIVFGKNTEVVEDKHGIKIHKLKRSATTYSISDTLLGEIISKLDDSQKKYVDEMQKYLSETMGGLGNEVSMKLYGVKMFGEENYFPLRSAGQYMEKAREADLQKQQGHTSLVNSGFTHAVKPHAKNPIVLDGFMDVWAGHVNEMAMYNGMVLPMEDFRKVYNYHTPFGEGSTSVNGVIENAYGAEATGYFDQLYQELNSGAISDPRESDMLKWVGKFKKAAVMLSMSVVVQQPSAIGRAFAIIDPKYFAGKRISESDAKKQWEEVKKYAPVAIIKEMGGFDTHTGAGAKDFLLAKEYSKDEIAMALKDKDYLKEKADMIMGYLPAKADELTWVAIWQAVKREVRANNPNLHGEEFLKKAGSRFSEVIEKTQVYDSILARSANMRAKTGLMTMATAFMAEPTTSINMIENAFRSKKNVGRVLASVVTAIIINNLLASAIYAMRDDDEDETFLEKYAQAFTSGMVDDLNPVTYYPFLKDVWSIFQGYDVERSDMSIISDVADALKKAVQIVGKDTSDMDEDELAEYHKTIWSAIMSLADSGFAAVGVPFKNVRRDVESWFNTIHTAKNGLSDNSTSLLKTIIASAVDALPVASYVWKTEKSDNLYDAIISGNTAYEERLRSEYADEKQITNAIRKGLRENDSRIYEAALAQINGHPEERVKLQREVIADGFKQDDVVSATNSIISKLSPSTSTSEPKKKGLYSTEDFALFVAGGNTALANDAKQDIIATHQLNGKTADEAEKSFQSSAKTDLKEMLLAGTVTVAAAEHALKTYCGMDAGEAKTQVNEWNYFKNTGVDYSDKKEKFLTGEVSASELVKALVSVEGKTEEAAAKTVVTYTRDAYEDGYFNRSKASEIMVTYGGLTSEEAENKLRYIDVKKQLPDTYVDDAWVEEYYKEVEPSGITIEVFVDYRNQVKEITGEGKKERRMAVINSMPISAAQKDALYFAEGWAASKLYEAPWR